MSHPETRTSLLIQIRDRDNAVAWHEFVRIYRPVICRVAIARGMQPADAEDLAQQVLVSVSSAIDRFDPNRGDAKFRTWLGRIANNAILNALTRGFPDRASGDDAMHTLLHQRPHDCQRESQLLETEFRRELFHLAAEQIRGEFSDATWDSFWRTAVEGQSIARVARRIGRTEGSVYAARSRVMKRLRENVQTLLHREGTH